MGKLTFKLRRAKIGETKSQRFDVAKLKNPAVKEDFSIALRNQYSLLQNGTALAIDSFNRTMAAAAIKTLGYKRRVKDEWLTADT